VTISRDDLEASLRDIQDVVATTEEDAKANIAVIVGAAVVVAVVVIAYGVWRSRRKRIHIQVFQTT
jgi:hypothetical protein